MTPFSKKNSSTLIEQWLAPFHRFIQSDTSAGLIMMCFMVIALVWANSPLQHYYEAFLSLPLSFGLGSWKITFSLVHWVNDGLMTLFFFVIGLEIKREVLSGGLSNKKDALAPLIAALGGMAVPALIYAIFNWETPALRGWAIPTATDIAFSLGVLSLVSSRVPLSLKLFLTTLAVGDDMGAILIIALFYGGTINWLAIAISIGLLLVLFGGNRCGIRSSLFYGFVTFILWIFVFKSGLHATLAGVLAASTIPFKTYITNTEFLHRIRHSAEKYESANHSCADYPSNPYHALIAPESVLAINDIQKSCLYIEPPLRTLEKKLHHWVFFFIVPLFTLCNAGVKVDFSGLAASFQDPVALGIIAGLVIGKPLGILSICFIASKFKIIDLAKDASHMQLLGVGCLAGIGFTMSLFVTNLAFATQPHLINNAKIGILVGSLISIIMGLTILYRFSRPKSNSI